MTIPVERSDLAIVLISTLMIGLGVGNALGDRYGHGKDPKGKLIHSMGPFTYRIGPGTTDIRVDIYGTDNPTQCVEFEGEKGQDGRFGSKGGEGGRGVFCGNAIAVFPGHAGEPVPTIPTERL